MDASGIVRSAGLRDATLRSISYDAAVRAAFVLRASDGAEAEVVLDRPIPMNIASLWEGSIVDTVFLWRADDVPPEIWIEADDGWNALLDCRVDPADRPAEARRLAARLPASLLVVVSCSSGGARAALVGSFRLLRR